MSAQYSLSALLRPITFCTVELCLSKCRPRRAITPNVLRRVTVSPAQSLSTCTSKCALLGSLCGVLLRLPWHSFQVPRHTFQLHHVTSLWFRHYSRQTLDRFRDVYTILRQNTDNAWFHSETTLLALLRELDCSRLHLPQQHSVSLSEF